MQERSGWVQFVDSMALALQAVAVTLSWQQAYYLKSAIQLNQSQSQLPRQVEQYDAARILVAIQTVLTIFWWLSHGQLIMAANKKDRKTQRSA